MQLSQQLDSARNFQLYFRNFNISAIFYELLRYLLMTFMLPQISGNTFQYKYDPDPEQAAWHICAELPRMHPYRN